MFKFSKDTYKAMANFEGINPILVFNENKSGYIGTVSESKSCIGFYNLLDDERQIPEFRIYNMTQFITLLNEFVENEHEVNFFDNRLEIISGDKKSKVTYFFATKELVDSQFKVPHKPTNFPEISAGFVLTSKNLKHIMKISAIFGYEQLVFDCTDTITITIKNIQDPSSNSWEQQVADNVITGMAPISIILSINDMKMDNTKDYRVSIAAGRIVKFTEAANGNLVYYISPYVMAQ